MNKTLKISLFAMISALAFNAMANTQPLAVLEPQVNYQQLLTQRQVVDDLIAQAVKIQNSPARVSNAGFTAKLPSNMERIAAILLEAYELEPYRVDFLFGAANANIYNGNTDKAIELYQKVLTVAPDDVKAHIYLTAWNRFKQNQGETDKYFTRLKALAPQKAAELEQVFKIIDNAASQPISDKLANKLPADSAIITLGYALNPDGSMHDILIQRLEKTLEIAKQNPDALIIVTGGVPQNNRTEGALMKQWLINKGIDAKRIYADNYARSTVENALFSRYALAKHHIKHAALISSGSHVRRGRALFEIAALESGPQNIKIETVAALDKPLDELQKVSEKDLLGIYRDSLKTMGLPMFNSGALQD
ncbi:transporter [Aggregatibacter actinomycetemcomitans]|uniref:YdcF family protein n=1 Tax=Aggregatibacter actinomycetemcomitans TaxID=714 RepID=UPI00022AB92A|nr:YdcF family protein [Aggregatibacter actinomycetemcomitans]ANU81611.1 transporter [Aggregatibacter actinomycetemcomitans]KYK83497.1 transporter [Aggregatibacter actinomycetemcomitans serotype d str. SA2200]KYK83592.1 transporter [Aggregatibacter actinomycetemcomitans serotype d str. SA3033]KYK91166.1 transporter [Aggregatibacter actinomycetemcomitans serotype d str. SA508]KYK94241.1 transporter [Aggregatibacter actinomycetemcomitans serotype d str. SA269]